MPISTQSYDVLLDFTNDLHDCVSIQILRDHGRVGAASVVLNPSETVTLVLESGSVYQYAIISPRKVAKITARTWRDINCNVSHLFSRSDVSQTPSQDGVSVDRIRHFA
ncbi:hypothetical protein BDQ17DRAFT_1340769 [Cyathus striatus]|nr:hypothetical protein BDQ17DRAFT_1340769 [Cyathus striatus]